MEGEHYLTKYILNKYNIVYLPLRMAKNNRLTFMLKTISIYLALFALGCNNNEVISNDTVKLAPSKYPLHTNITATIFWVGEQADASNAFIANDESAWDSHWKENYGGTDDPNNRNGYYPASFTPKENPFYFALPYNDVDTADIIKQSAKTTVYWASEKTWSQNESMCKNRWIQIIIGNKVAFAQWEDVGPFETEDAQYVFGSGMPVNKFNGAGLDVSPAVKDYLGLTGVDKVSWQFVEYKDIFDGPWKNIITISQIQR